MFSGSGQFLFAGNESDNVYVSAVMVKIMSVAQREEKARDLEVMELIVSV